MQKSDLEKKVAELKSKNKKTKKFKLVENKNNKVIVERNK